MTAPQRPSRRGFLAATLATAAGSSLAAGGAAADAMPTAPAAPVASPARDTEPFWGTHQGGILTRPQRHAYFAAFDIIAAGREDVVQLLRAWTAAAALFR